MPSRDTKPYRITNKTIEEIERIRKVLAKETGIHIEDISKKKAEIVLRIKSTRGKISESERDEIIMGKIK